MSTESRYSTIEVIENGLETHFTLQKAWNEFKTKDPVDSLHNAKMLVAACEERLKAIEEELLKEETGVNYAFIARHF